MAQMFHRLFTVVNKRGVDSSRKTLGRKEVTGLEVTGHVCPPGL
jgi:hypothetical protein